MICSRCQFDNPAGGRYCGQCGAALHLACGRCGAGAPPGFKFCGECGAPLSGRDDPPAVPSAEPRPAPAASTPREGLDLQPAAPPAPIPASDEPPDPSSRVDCGDSEIKHATVLYCELVSDQAPIDEPEVEHTLVSRFIEVAQAEIQRFGGEVNQALGRGLLGVFGAPLAQEDHAWRSILAAVALRRRLAELAAEVEARHGVSWTVRMGLDTGVLVTGGVEGVAIGDTTEHARRLVEAAAPGTILLGDRLARVVEPEVVVERETPATGGDGGVGTWRLVSVPAPLSTPPRFRGRSLGPFVGRDREMAVLEDLRRQAETGQGQVVGISGEAGAGKSRLIHEFSRTLKDAAISHLHGQCLSYASGTPYGPLIEMIRRASRITDADGPLAVAKLRRSLESVGLDPEEMLPYFLRLLGLPEASGALDRLEAHTIQAQTFAAMRRMVLTASRRSLVVMEVEDLHWIDETSREFLDSLIEEMAGTRLLLLLTYRSGYRPGWLDKSYATQITLRRLSPDESRLVVGSILRSAEPDDERVRSIVEMAEGNPFFLEELARSLVDGAAAESQLLVPGTVHGVLMSRLDRLPEAHKRLLQMASVLGREVSVELLERIWDRTEALPGLLADLQRWEFLFTPPAREPGLYCFRHSLTQEVAYQSLLKSRRRLLHAQIASALEGLYAGRLEEVYDRLIYHYPRSGEAAKTVHYLALFAQRGARHYAHAEAAKALREALAHAQRLPEDARDRRVVEILLQLAESLLPLARLLETREVFDAHRQEIERVDDPALQARVHFWLAHTHTYLGDQEQAQRDAEIAIESARRCSDEGTEGKAYYVLGRNAFWAGRFREGLEQSVRAVVLLERNGEPWWQGQAYWVAGFHQWALGRHREALEALARTREIGEALDDHRLDASWSIGFVHSSRGDWQEGLKHCQRGVEGSRDPLNTAVAMGFLGHAFLCKGDADAAIQALRQSAHQLSEAGMQQLLGWFTAFLGEAYAAAGRLEEAQEAAAEGAQISREARFGYGTGLARRTLGLIALAVGATAEARAHLDSALEILESLEMPFEIGRTHLLLAQVSEREGDTDGAARSIAEVERRFDALGLSDYAPRIEALGIPGSAGGT